MRRKVFMIISVLLVALLFVFGCVQCVKVARSTPPVQLGQPASSAAEPETPSAFGSFQATDLEGNSVDQSVFAKADLTMMYIWATYCNPCLSEMPELEELSQEYREKNVQVIGVVLDVLNQDGTASEEQAETAREAVRQTGVTYPNLLLNPELLINNLPFAGTTPEVFFIDKEGNYVGEHYLGRREKAAWAKIIDERLAEVTK